MNKTLEQMLIYGIGSACAKAVSYLLVPLYTKMFLPATYGILELVYTSGSLIGILYGFMIGSAYIRFYYGCKDEEGREILFSSAFWFTVISCGAFVSIVFLLSEDIGKYVFKFSNGPHLLVLISISTAIYAVSSIYYNQLVVKQRAREYVSVNLITLIVTILLTILFVFLNYSVEGVLYAQIIGRIVELIILSFLFFRKKIFMFSFYWVKEMLKYSTPLIPVQISAFVLNFSNRFYLQEYTTLESVGIYSLAYKIASVLLLFAIEPLRGFTPYIFSLADSPQKCKRILADCLRYYIFVIYIVTILISMFSKEIILLIANKNYFLSWNIIYLISMSFCFYGMAVFSSHAIEIVKKNSMASIVWFIAGIMSILLNFVLIPYKGIVGASFVNLVSYLLVFIGYLLIAKIFYPTPFNYKSIFNILTVGTVIYYLSTLVNYGVFLSSIIKVILFVIFVSIILLSGYFTKDEIAKAKKMSLKIRSILLLG